LPFTETENPAAASHRDFASSAFYQAVKELSTKLLTHSHIT